MNVYLAGDSTMADYPTSSFPQTGWGQMLPHFFTKDVFTYNFAANGRSTKSFLAERRLKDIESRIQPHDYLFIQFGHNDSKPEAARRTEPFSTYQRNLETFIETARALKANPIFLTPIQRRKFNESGELLPTHGDYPVAMRETAKRQDVPLVDLTTLTTELLQAKGPEAAKQLFMWYDKSELSYFPEGVQDDTHLNQEGAKKIAELAANGLASLSTPLAEHILLK